MPDLSLLKIDLDRKFTPAQWSGYMDRLKGVLRITKSQPQRVAVYETKKGFHVKVQLSDPLPSAEALVCLQACSGSDGFREALNLMRALSGRTGNWNVLFIQKTTIEDSYYSASAGVTVTYSLKKSLALKRTLETVPGWGKVECGFDNQELALKLLKQESHHRLHGTSGARRRYVEGTSPLAFTHKSVGPGARSLEDGAVRDSGSTGIG